tara:strand:+ start:572 stop:802 length:231 start_codon:yes stop_codon:yes gene_type:complete
MIIDLKVRNQIAQLIVDMSVGESKPVKRPEMVPIIKEVNDTALIGHALRFVTTPDGDVIQIKKYRRTAIEKRYDGN